MDILWMDFYYRILYNTHSQCISIVQMAKDRHLSTFEIKRLKILLCALFSLLTQNKRLLINRKQQFLKYVFGSKYRI